jgi:hypothetical protein
LYLGIGSNHCFELLEALGRVPVNTVLYHIGEIHPALARLEPHDALANHAAVLKLPDTSRARRLGESNAVGHLLVAQAAVSLKLGEDF